MRRAVVCVLLPSFIACTHQQPYGNIYQLAGQEVVVETNSGRTVDVIAVPEPDGLTFRPIEGDLQAVDIAHVIEIRRGRGALEGLGLGALVGVATGAVIGYAGGADTCDPADHRCIYLSAGDKAFLSGIVVGVLGGGLGLIVGAIRGSRFVYSTSDQPRVIPTGPPGSVVGASVTF